MLRVSQPTTASLMIAGLLFAASLRAQTTTTWSGTTNNEWTEATNWSNDLPSSGRNASIQSGTVYLDGTGAARYLSLAGASGATASLFIEDGAQLTVSAAQASLIGTGAGATGAVTQTGGSASFANSLIMGGTGASGTGGTASYTISRGSLTVSGGSGLLLGNNTTSSSTSQFTQSGGAVTLAALSLGSARYGGGTGTPTNIAAYTISGGTLTVSGNFTQGLTTTSGSGRVEATTQIVGSTANVSVGGDLTLNNNTRNTSTLAYVLDDGGVSKINLTGTGTATLAGTLSAGFKGGLALTTTESFTLIEADTGNISGSFGTTPDSALWSVTAPTAVSGTRDAVVLSLQGSAQKAALTASATSATFAASTTGYVTLDGLTAGDTVSLYLAADAGTGETIADLVSYFTANGIAATALSGDGSYSVLVTRQAAASASWFAWDLSGFNADATLSGIGFATAIPEPSTWTLLLGTAGLLVAAGRRLRR